MFPHRLTMILHDWTVNDMNVLVCDLQHNNTMPNVFTFCFALYAVSDLSPHTRNISRGTKRVTDVTVNADRLSANWLSGPNTLPLSEEEQGGAHLPEWRLGRAKKAYKTQTTRVENRHQFLWCVTTTPPKHDSCCAWQRKCVQIKHTDSGSGNALWEEVSLPSGCGSHLQPQLDINSGI